MLSGASRSRSVAHAAGAMMSRIRRMFESARATCFRDAEFFDLLTYISYSSEHERTGLFDSR